MKIKMTVPVVEMQGDEMTRILWDWIKEILLEPYIELNTEFYDLGLENRDKTDDQVTIDAANAIKRLGVGVKCATITPNHQRMTEYTLKKMWLSPNGTIRAILDGTVFRAPILVDGIKPYIPSWVKPITIARHAYGDMYKNVESLLEKGSRAEILITKADGSQTKLPIFDFESGGGVVSGMHNTDKSIYSFARACFNYAVDTEQELWFGAKDTISKTYDNRFKAIFNELYENEYKKKFDDLGIKYEYSLIDDSISRLVRSSGGLIWALKNYDGDVMSDMVATAYGSLAMMTSVLVSPEGNYEYEAAHGTVTRHYYKYRDGEQTSTNSVATIFAWTGALYRRGKMDNNNQLCDFAKKLEKAVIKTIEQGVMTGDLVGLFQKENITPKKVSSKEFLTEIAKRLETI